MVIEHNASWIEVAEVLGYPTPRAAKVAVERALEDELHEGDREHLRQYAGRKLNSLLKAVWGKAHDEDSPEQLAAVGAARSILSDHIKLWGLAAPSEMIVTSPSEREIETWVAGVVTRSTPQLEEADIFSDVIEGEVITDTEES